MDTDGAARQTRIAARLALIASTRTACASGTTAVVAAQAVMAGVSLNTISNQNITDINANLVTAAAAVASALTALNTSMPLTAE